MGRVLYNMDTVWVGIEKRGKSWVISDSERPKLDKAYTNMLTKLGLTPAKAGGTQSQLTPKASTAQAKESGEPAVPKAAPISNAQSAKTQPTQAQQPTRAQQPMQQKASTPAQAGKIAEIPAKPPACEYVVTSLKIEKGMSSSNTRVALAGQDNKELTAFVRGVREDLAVDAQLYNVKLTTRRQDTVVFYVLESYEVIVPAQRAA